MHKYVFTGLYSRVFTELRSGDGVAVRRKNGPDPLVGETVRLDPGDTITSRQPIEHPELVEAPVRAPRTPSTPIPEATLQEE